MEDANTAQGTSSQASVAPAPSDLPESQQVDPAPPVPSPSSSQGNDDEDDRSSSSYRASEQNAGRFTDDPKSHVDTAAPIDSVKGAVNRFGGTLDRREKRVQVQDHEIHKVQQDVTEYEKRWQEAEASKVLALQELQSAVSAADELRLRLEKSQAEEAQPRQETDGAAANAELDVLRAAALADLQSARAELASLEKERAAAVEAGKALVEVLAAELVALKGDLESAHAAHGEAEEKTRRLAAAFEQDKSQWQSELEEAEQEAKKLKEELMAACDLESKAEAASELLARLKAELSACSVAEDEETQPQKAMLEKSKLEETKKELDDVKESIEKAKHEVNRLRVAAASMRDDLEREKAELAELQRKHNGLTEELNRATSDLAAAAAAEARANNEESKQMDVELEEVGEARRQAEQAKASARSAREEVDRAREEARVAKAAVAAVEARLEAVTREILAANTSEEVATASANAVLQERKASREDGATLTLTTEEYEELSRRARETEEAAGKRVMEAVKLIKEAKDAEVRSLEKLAQVAKQTEQRRQALQAATEDAEEAEFAKLSAERELRQWRAEHQQPRTGLAEISVLDEPGGDGRGNPHILSPRAGYMPMVVATGAAAEAAEARQRKAFLPRMVMFLARRRAQSWK